MSPTKELYQSLLTAFRHFNNLLFDGALPEVIFTVQRQKGVLGYFAPDRWSSVEGEHCHEIAINPAHLGQSRVIDVLQTLVHEMVHCWQYSCGTPGRRNYHNKEWAFKMISVGLQPTSTGLPGGGIVGEQMSDYPIEGGQFLLGCELLIAKQSFSIAWIDRQPCPKSTLQVNSAHTATDVLRNDQITTHENVDSHSSLDNLEENLDSIRTLMQTTYSEILPENTIFPIIRNTKTKNKYQCPSCGNRVWGKPEMHLICGDCDCSFQSIE